ncbi:MAG: hypothetical protein HY614_04000 [Candidatus Rokubacteria bacterium]|nr:hypothetical protein [Candidatus Rokubacteria bacterium]
MSRRGLGLNALLGGLALVFAGYITQVVVTPPPTPVPPRPRPAVAPPPPTAPATAPGAYGVIASRNLFNPSRSEAAATPGAAAQLPKPNLYGVVLQDGTPIAYLEDPVTKRVAGYRVGDTVAGGTVQSIAADRVVLVRPEGQVDVRLHDPAKPRPAPPAVPGAPVQPPLTPGRRAITPPPVTPPGAEQQITPTLPPGRRVLPPNLLRRTPPGTGDSATTR